MTTDRQHALWGQPGAGGAYHGFSVAPPHAVAPTGAARAWKPPRAATVAAGVGGALVLGLAFGFLAKPDLGRSHLGEPMRAVTPATATAQPTMAIEVNAPRPPAPVKSAGKLEVLPPEMARNAPRAMPAYADLPPPPATQQVAPLSTPRITAPPLITPPQPSPRYAPRYAPGAPQVASLDPACAGARSRAAQMVCSDPDLTAADRELNRAYRRAMRSGAPPDQLRQEQRDWLAIREDAARRSPRAVADIYEQRINELNDLADDGPG